MDAASHYSKRLYPAYTTDELRARVEKAGANADPRMVEEIARRDAGASKHLSVPQTHSPAYRLFAGR